jgi:hypothetical protein
MQFYSHTDKPEQPQISSETLISNIIYADPYSI